MGFLARWNLLTFRLNALRVLRPQTLVLSGILGMLTALLLGIVWAGRLCGGRWFEWCLSGPGR